jgi:hypothetical protein
MRSSTACRLPPSDSPDAHWKAWLPLRSTRNRCIAKIPVVAPVVRSAAVAVRDARYVNVRSGAHFSHPIVHDAAANAAGDARTATSRLAPLLTSRRMLWIAMIRRILPGLLRCPAPWIESRDCDDGDGLIPDEVRERSCMLQRLSLNRSSPLIVHYCRRRFAACPAQPGQQRLKLSPDAVASSSQSSRTRPETPPHCYAAIQGTLNKRSTHA